MTLVPAFTEDVSKLESDGFGHRSLTWWGVIGFMVIEATGFALLFGAYFFLMSHEQNWAPLPLRPPDLLAGTLFTIVILLSEIPNTMVKKAALRLDLGEVRRLMPWVVGFGAVLLVIRAFEFNSLNVFWYDNAYGSILWALLLMHTTHLGTDWADTFILWRLMVTRHGEQKRRFVDTDENALYWRFVWLSWLPVYVLIYWLPRLFQ
jgi:heme/copper-type cytochrome/quinol oxidase subunit 3